MKGKILGYNKESQTGVIINDNNKRYHFKRSDWKSPNEPTVGSSVDFNATDDEMATEIYRLVSNAFIFNSDEKNRILAAVFAFFLGVFGVHKFYLGYQKQGVIMLLSIFPGGILIFPPIIMGIISFIECILYLTKSDEQFQELYIDNSRPWF